ncbi:serine protease [Chamaesiphon sp. VAR_48_metabat_403]|uniref:S1 family peptidase n=1 Tax=Chamaesiphon sp. VAR_48_metabat_403 TaxID=2964700 RepID=UPI00286E4695|nr:serine protease [Chamaesiphon sp. VAR_48_metabat_403]
MSSRISLWTGLIGVSATIAFAQRPLYGIVQPVIAKTPVQVGEIARAITVLISEPNSQGSGVIIQRQGDTYTVLTTRSVVRQKADYKITTPDDRQYQIVSGSLRVAPGDIDLAVVKFKSTTNYATAKLGNSNSLKSGMALYLAGFSAPSTAITQSIFGLTSGAVIANSNKIFRNGYSLISNITRPGMAGGAVLNNDGELVAIHGQGDSLSERLRQRDSDGNKTGFNLGIPIDRFITIANAMGVKLDKK